MRQTCFVSDGDPPMMVSWFKDGISLLEENSMRVTQIDPVTSMLAISNLSAAQHAGNFSCVAKNAVAVVSVTASLVVKGNNAPAQSAEGKENKFLVNIFLLSQYNDSVREKLNTNFKSLERITLLTF